jgi:hypothetical protein
MMRSRLWSAPRPTLRAALVLVPLTAALLAPIGLGLGSAFAAGNTFYVSTGGSDGGDGSAANPWRTIQRAVRADSPVSAGSTVIVRPGEYRETIVRIEKPGITLKGEPGATLVNVNVGDSRLWFNNGAIEVKRVNNVTITGMTVDANSNIWGGIVGNDLTGFRVLNNSIKNSLASGVIVLHGGSELGEGEVQSRDLKVIGNTLFNTGLAKNDQEALSIWGVDGFEVAYNSVEQGQREGIDAKVGSRNGSIHHNTVRRQALFFAPAADAGPAIYVDANRADISNVSIYSNLVEDNLQHAITITSETNNKVRGVRVYNNVTRRNGRPNKPGSAVAICGDVSGVDIAYNTFFDSTNAVDVRSNCYFPGTPQNIAIRNNVFFGMRWRLIEIDPASSVTVTNNVSTAVTTDVPQQFEGSGERLWNAAGSNNKLVGSICFVGPPDDLQLTSGSPAIDIGTSATPSFGDGGLTAIDVNGAPRPQGNAPDAGAYESGGSGATTTTISTMSTTSTTISNQGSASLIGGGQLATGWQSYSWSGTITQANGWFTLTGADPWVGVRFSRGDDVVVDTANVSELRIAYRTPGKPIQVLVFNQNTLVGKTIIESTGSTPQSVAIPWTSLGSPVSITSLIVQDASGTANTIGVSELVFQDG